MRSLDPRHWNLVPPAALLAVTACGPGAVALDDGSVAGDGDGDGDTTGDGDGDDGGCQTDADCPSGYYCAGDGVCQYEYWCGGTLPHQPGTVSQGPIRPACSPPYECYSDADCGSEMVCEFGYCYPAPPPECEPHGMHEIPLPQLQALDLAFTDVDADGRDELVFFRDGLLTVLDDTQPGTVVELTDVGVQQITPVRADDDPHLDLVLTSRDSPVSVVLLGDGLGGFTPVSGGPQAPLLGPVAGDWALGGAQELIGIDVSDLAIYADLTAQPPSKTTIVPDHGDVVDDVGYGHWATGGPGLVTTQACAIIFHVPEGEPPPGFLPLDEAQCSLAVGRFDLSDFDDVVALRPGFADSDLHLVLDNAVELHYPVSGYYDTATPIQADGAGPQELLLSGGDAPALVRLSDAGVPQCHTTLANLPFSTRMVAGDFYGDGRSEVALIDGDGLLRLFTED